jgi:hypothetical protein
MTILSSGTYSNDIEAFANRTMNFRGSGSWGFFAFPKAGDEFYFLTNPVNSGKDNSWTVFNYCSPNRDGNAFYGLDQPLPGEIGWLPVYPNNNDALLKLVVPYVRSDNKFPDAKPSKQVQNVAAINVYRKRRSADTGLEEWTHNVLMLSQRPFTNLKNTFEKLESSFARKGVDWSPTESSWVYDSGDWREGELDADIINQLPAPIDLVDYLNKRRAAVVDHLTSVGFLKGEESSYSAEEAYAAEKIVDDGGVPDAVKALVNLEETSDFANLSTADLRTKLMQAGIPIPEKGNRGYLLALADEWLPKF